MAEENLEFEMDRRENFSEEDESGGNTGLIIALIFFILLSIGLGALLALNEFVLEEPLFGKTKELYEDNQKMSAEHDGLVAQADSLGTLSAALKEDNDILSESIPGYDEGTFYLVQIGAFENFDMSRYYDGMTKFGIEVDADLNKYTIGKFRSYSKAMQFKRDIIRMGIQDAWVVKKKDGMRTEL